MINAEKIIAIVCPDSAPIKRMVQRAKEAGSAIDATQGRKTKAVLVMENGNMVLSALMPETLAGRVGVSFDTYGHSEEIVGRVDGCPVHE